MPFAGAQNREQPMVLIKPRRKRAKSYVTSQEIECHDRNGYSILVSAHN